MPTATWKSRLRSGSAHCDLQLAVEVRQCPLRSGAFGGGPAVPTGIWTARRRWRVRRRRRQRRRRRRRTALIKSNNPHLAGGDILAYTSQLCVSCHIHSILSTSGIFPLLFFFKLKRGELTLRKQTWRQSPNFLVPGVIPRQAT